MSVYLDHMNNCFIRGDTKLSFNHLYVVPKAIQGYVQFCWNELGQHTIIIYINDFRLKILKFYFFKLFTSRKYFRKSFFLKKNSPKN